MVTSTPLSTDRAAELSAGDPALGLVARGKGAVGNKPRMFLTTDCGDVLGEFNRWSQRSIERSCDGQANGVGCGVDGPAAMRSPGRPPAGRREHRLRFWAAIARGLTSDDAAVEAGVSAAVGVRWFREGGGMPSVTLAPLSGRYLSFAEREEIALLRRRGCGVREIARRLGRSPSTISRELRRNAATRGGKLEYRASVAQWQAELTARRPKTGEARREPRCASMCRTASPARCVGPTGRPWRVRNVAWIGRRHGRAQGPPVGDVRGARSRSLTGCAWTSPMMSRCGSPTRRSTSRCTCRAAAR